MDYPRRVRRRQPRGDLRGNVQNLFERQLSPRNQLAEGLPVDELGGDEMNAFDFPDFVNRQDIRMIQTRSGVCLGLKTTQPRGVRNEIRRQQLERNEAFEPCIVCEINFAHAARAEPFRDAVRPDRAPDICIRQTFGQHARVMRDGGLLDKVARFVERTHKR